MKVQEDGAAAAKMKDFAFAENSMGGVTKVHTIPIKAGKEHTGMWRRVKVTAFSVMHVKG